ncbi:MAG: hypothetical protein M3O90_03145 [Actinomycetota bacterium]|nr:hypothetical protein [Actinomycetota bacterium]
MAVTARACAKREVARLVVGLLGDHQSPGQSAGAAGQGDARLDWPEAAGAAQGAERIGA